MDAKAQRFERWAPFYDEGLMPLLTAPVHRAVLAAARRHLPEPARVLDVGCGTGRLLNQARSAFPGAQLIGVDAAHTMLAVARLRGEGKAPLLVQAHAESLPLTEHSVDIVMATLSCRHWRDVRAGLAEIARVLRPRGVLVYADLPTPASSRHTWWQPSRRSTRKDLFAELAAQTGLRLLQAHPIAGHVPIPSFFLAVASAGRPNEHP